jgi:type VI secretion system protein ImpG
MTDELLPYYNRELSFLRRMGAEFAQANPKIAGRLRLGPDSSEDPHVERLIEAFAYLTARIRHKLDDDLPELTEGVLGVLYPHYLAPVPSMSIVQFRLHPTQSELTTGYTVPRESVLETEPIQGEPCRFRSCYATTLWPVELKSASLSRPPFTAPVTRFSAQAAAVLQLTLRCNSEQVTFAKLPLNSLRFFLKGQSQHVFSLYELLFNNTLQIALASPGRKGEPTLLDRQCLRQVGFERDEGLLPYAPRSSLGYRLLSEYFGFTEKFLFFDLTGLTPQALKQAGNQLDIFFYLNRTTSDLEQNLNADMFRLGCTPIVNLFRQRAEPIKLTHNVYQYRVVPDARRPRATEVYSIDRVTATSPAGEQVEYVPFYSMQHAVQRGTEQPFWHATRKTAGESESRIDDGTEVLLSLVDLDFHPSAPANWTLDVETTCLNRDLPNRLPFGGDQPRLQLAEGGAPLGRILCLSPPTRTLRPSLRDGALWRLLSHLTLNHLSLVDNELGAEALRETLRLYDFSGSPEKSALVEGILSVNSRRVAGRVGGHLVGGFCRGVEVTVNFDEKRFSGSSVFLFASVLERFLALHCSINSFTKLTATIKGRDAALRQWPPRAGERVLV